jgi:hypothetical protein
LLAEAAGVLAGFREGEPDEAKAKAAAQLCRQAGADETVIPQWGRGRAAPAAIAQMMPHSGQPRRRR